MPCFVAIMRNVDHGGGVVGQDFEHIARGERAKTFAGLEDGQGAQQAKGIKLGHGVYVVRLRALVHGGNDFRKIVGRGQPLLRPGGLIHPRDIWEEMKVKTEWDCVAPEVRKERSTGGAQSEKDRRSTRM